MSHSTGPLGTHYLAVVDALREIAKGGSTQRGMSDQEYANRFLSMLPSGDVTRTLACVNACRGIPIGLLERATILSLLAAVEISLERHKAGSKWDESDERLLDVVSGKINELTT